MADVRGRLLRLASELEDERAVAGEIARVALADSVELRAAEAAAQARALAAVVALDLHRWYTALESMLERIERVFGTLPTGPEWHRDLLGGASSAIVGVRPAILPKAVMPPLRELLGLRHFLRHAYAVEFEPSKLLDRAGDLLAVSDTVTAAITAFVGFLRTSAEALES